MLASVLRRLVRGFAAKTHAPRDQASRAQLITEALERERDGRDADAERVYRSLLESRPDDADVLHLLGHLAARQKRYEEAAGVLERAVSLAPDVPEIHFELGRVFGELKLRPRAIAAYETAVDLAPDMTVAWNNLGQLYKAVSEWDKAEQCFRRYIALVPDSAFARSELGTLLLEIGRVDEAIESLRAAVEITPTSPHWRTNLLYALNFDSRHSPQAVFEEHRRWGELHAQPLTAASSPPRVDRTPGRKLRVGYVSPNFRHHPVSYFFEPTLKEHDYDAFDVTCYSDVAKVDDYTRRLQSHGTWKDTSGMTDGELAERVREDRIDILVDLSGHTLGNRLLTFARRPAPVQVTWNGYANTTGMAAMDYRITDAFADPPGMTEHLHTERLVRLPEIYMAFQPAEPMPPVTAPPSVEAGYVTFGSFNTLAKLGPAVIAVWSRILASLPAARLVVCTVPEGETRARVLRAFAAHGVAAERLQLLPRLKFQDFLAAHALVDVALDPFPFTGTTTTCHTLWMGVPVVTLAGAAHAGRVGVSMLSNAGLEHLVAADETQYVDRAVAVGQNTDELVRLRETMRDRMRASPNMNGPRLTRFLEAEYVRMWNDYCAKAGPAARESER